MSLARFLFLAGSRPWLEVLDAEIVRRGEGYDPEWRQSEVLTAVAPASDVTIHWLDLPDLSPAQANAAARLLLADRLLGDVHVACGTPDALGTRPVAVVAAEKMRDWIEELDPDALVPAQMIIAAPEEGLVRAEFGPEAIVRGKRLAIIDDPALTPLLSGGAEIATHPREAIEHDALSAIRAPALDLRQGVFARKTSWLPDWARLKPLARLGAALLLVTLAIPLAKIVRLSIDAKALNAETAEVARKAVGESVSSEEAAGLLRDRLSAMRGGGAGFAGTAGAAIASVSATPNVELISLGFASDGILRMTARATSQAELDMLASNMRASGLSVVPGVASMEQGRPRMEFQVKGQ